MTSQTRTGKINTTNVILIKKNKKKIKKTQTYSRTKGYDDSFINTVADTVHNQHNDVTISCQDSRSC